MIPEIRSIDCDCGRELEARALAGATSNRSRLGAVLAALVLAALPFEAAWSEAAPTASADPTTSTADPSSQPQASFFEATTVTATGSAVDEFEIATPVTVLGASQIEQRAPQNAAALLASEPGVDVNGVGPNQPRPVIRGQRGLRVLLLEDGLRLNNARRQTDFGEITGLVDIEDVDAVEIVRGPASVLYGSDALGGVLNVITKTPSYRQGQALGGAFGVRYGSAGDEQRVFGSADGRAGKFSYRLGLTYRDASEYKAASGSFGRVHLAKDTPVRDTGVTDKSASFHLGYQLSDEHSLALRWHRYKAGETGFGFVEPSLLGEGDDARIRILYPNQDFDRWTLSYLGSNLHSWAVDNLDVQAYRQSNQRELANQIDVNIGPIFPGAPNSSVHADTLNKTDLDTTGLRLEAVKLAGQRHLITYGFEGTQDDSHNTDASVITTTIRFPFPPFERVRVTSDNVANAPNATNRNYGVFAQDEVTATEKLKLTVGGRYQRVETQAEATPGWDTRGLDFSDSAVVGAVSGLYRLKDYLHLVASYGTAFRAPNIIERLFNGPTPEGAGYQILNRDLTSETSSNFDLGLKYRRQNAIAQATVFRTEIKDGIVQEFLSPAEVAALPPAVQEAIRQSGARFVVQQQNVEKLRYEGVEVSLAYRSPRGLSVGGNYTYLDGKRIDSSAVPIGDTFGEKINFYAHYQPTGGRYWVEYRFRHNGREKANLDPDEPDPAVGRTLPAFTVHTLSGGVTLFERGNQRHSLALVVDNLTNELYAEFSNATFFRPQPKRNVTATYRVGF
ncbi:MAG: TonB-dependent receptor [Thermoanaerobaculia bacterium]